jgi:hypothetical protein
MRHIVRAFFRQEEGERCAHQVADLVESAGAGRAHEGLQFGKRHLNRVEVRTVRREKAHTGPGLLDHRADLRLLMAGEVVEDDHIAGPERRDQDLLHVRAERDGIHRAVEHGGGRQLGGPERRDDGVRLPMATRCVIRGTRPARTAGVSA